MESTKHENVYKIVLQTLKVISILQICPICKYHRGKPSLFGGKDTRDTHSTGDTVRCRPNWDFSKRTNSKYTLLYRSCISKGKQRRRKTIKMINLFHTVENLCVELECELALSSDTFVICNFFACYILYVICHLIATYTCITPQTGFIFKLPLDKMMDFFLSIFSIYHYCFHVSLVRFLMYILMIIMIVI